MRYGSRWGSELAACTQGGAPAREVVSRSAGNDGIAYRKVTVVPGTAEPDSSRKRDPILLELPRRKTEPHNPAPSVIIRPGGPLRIVAWFTWSGRERSSQSRSPQVPQIRLASSPSSRFWQAPA